MRNKFDMQLDLLNEQLTHMGGLCEVAINRGTEALKKGDLKQAAEVIRADEEIDQMEKDNERKNKRKYTFYIFFLFIIIQSYYYRFHIIPPFG